MKIKIVYIVLAVLFFGCDGENAPDCIQNAGDIIQEDFAVIPFTEIIVFNGVELIIKESPTYSVTIETGENLMDDVSVNVVNGRLVLKNNSGCNLTRDYGITKAFVNAPNLTLIWSSTSFPVRSEGVLNYDSLELRSEDSTNPEVTHTDGIFDLEVNSDNMLVVVNNLATVFLSGSVNAINIRFVSGDARFEGRNLIAQDVKVYHRGTNDITIHPQVSLDAELVSTGDVIVVNTPPVLTLEELYTGRVIFE